MYFPIMVIASVIANRCAVVATVDSGVRMVEQDKGGSKDELFDLPEGFVGWTGNINHPVPMFKMYISRICRETIRLQEFVHLS